MSSTTLPDRVGEPDGRADTPPIPAAASLPSVVDEVAERHHGPTLASTWLNASDTLMTDELVQWPADLFAFANVILAHAQAFRLALSPPAGQHWPPADAATWTGAIEQAARSWRTWVEERRGPLPELLTEQWAVVRDRADLPLEQLARGDDWPLCVALLTLHAIADEACAHLSVAFDYGNGEACFYRAQSRELLARNGSLARISTAFLRVLPKAQTPPTGRAAFSRYVCVVRSGIDVHWHKLPFRTSGTGPEAERGNLLLLPWPMRIREADFRVVPGSVKRMSKEPFGLFEFAPHERLDLDLVDRMLVAARDEVGSIDIVMLPESAIDEDEIAGLEAVLDAHGVASLRAGVRDHSAPPGQLRRNWMHIGVNPRLDSSGPLASGTADRWFHLRQYKHHRWSLDERQISQYHLGGVLHPHIRWYEAMDTPRPAVQFLEVGAGTLTVNLVCEDLTQNDEVSDVIRSVGPTFLTAFLLDGPQLPSRWGARYASVMADDPGAAVLTLTSYGMVRRSRTARHDPSDVVALWKDSDGGTREISLEPGAQGVLLSVAGDVATRRSADGRWPADTGTSIFDAAVQQIYPAEVGSMSTTERPASREPAASLEPAALDVDELTILTGWAEGVAEALAYAPDRVLPLLSAGRAEPSGGGRWR